MAAFDPSNPLRAFFSRTEAEVLKLLFDAPRPLSGPALSTTGVDRKSVSRVIKRLEPLGVLCRIPEGRRDEYMLNTEHVLYEPIRQAHEAGRRLQANLDAEMKNGWTARWSGEEIHLVAPADRANKVERGGARVKQLWKQWTGQDIEVHVTIRRDSGSTSA